MNTKQLRRLRRSPVSADTGNRVALAFEITERSQMDCVRGTGFTAPYVSDVRRGRFRNLSLDNAHRFAAFFGCAIEDLFPSRETRKGVAA